MIWCVQDDASIRDIEVYAVNSTGFSAEGFADGAAFWAALEKDRPELVVLDVMLPEIDGIQLLRRMKADPALRDIPVIMATAKGAEYDKILGLDLGADDYLTKPFGVGAGRYSSRYCAAAALPWTPRSTPSPLTACGWS